MQRHFYFFRHGQTNENNLGKRYGDGINAWLTDFGVLQAKKLKEYFANKNIEVVYSSPYKRAIDTAKIAVPESENVKIIVKDELKETIFWFLTTESEEKKRQINKNFHIIKECFEHIVKEDKHKSIAISSHGAVTRALCWVCGHKVERVKNGECFHFVFDSGKWIFLESFCYDK